MKSFKLLCLVFILPTLIFGQKVKFKKDQIYLDKNPILRLVNSQDETSFTYKNEKGRELKLDFEFAMSINKIFESYKIHFTEPNISIDVEMQNISAKTANKASVGVIEFLLRKGIILSNGDFNTSIDNIENFCKEIDAKFWIEKSSLAYSIKNYTYNLSTIYLGENKNKEVYRVSLLNEDKQIVKSLDILKHLKDKGEEITSQIKLVDNVFIIEKLKTLKDGTRLLGLDKVYFDDNGNPYGDKENGSFFKEREETAPKEREYVMTVTEKAVFKGGNKNLYKWMGQNFETYEFEAYVDENTSRMRLIISFDINKEGFIENTTVRGTDSEKIKEKVIQKMKKMPQWTPAKSGQDNVKSSFTIPLKLVFN